MSDTADGADTNVVYRNMGLVRAVRAVTVVRDRFVQEALVEAATEDELVGLLNDALEAMEDEAQRRDERLLELIRSVRQEPEEQTTFIDPTDHLKLLTDENTRLRAENVKLTAIYDAAEKLALHITSQEAPELWEAFHAFDGGSRKATITESSLSEDG